MCVQKSKGKKKHVAARRAVALVTLAAVGILAKGTRSLAVLVLGCNAQIGAVLTRAKPQFASGTACDEHASFAHTYIYDVQGRLTA